MIKHRSKTLSLPTWTRQHDVDTIFVPKHDTELITINLGFPAGAYFDPDTKPGLANLFSDMLLRGTRQYPRDRFEEELDYLGAALSVDSGYHTCVLRGQVLSRNLRPFIELVREALLEPSFSKTELETWRNIVIGRLHLRLEDDAFLARAAFVREIFRGHPYSQDLRGSEASLSKITNDDITSFYSRHIHRGGLAVGAAGGLDENEFDATVASFVSGLRIESPEVPVIPHEGHFQGRRVILVDKPERTQTHFLIGHPTLSINHPDYIPLQIFVTAFGGHIFQAVYFQEIRVKRGWSYGAYATVDSRRDGGSFYLYTFPAVKDTIPAIQKSIELLESAVHGDLVSDEQLSLAKNYLCKSFPFQIDTPEEIMGKKLHNKFVGRPDDYLEKYVDTIHSIGFEEIRRAAATHLHPDRGIVSVLCSAKDIQADIGAALETDDITVIPFDQLL